MAALTYIRTYHPYHYTNAADFEYQEYLRTIDSIRTPFDPTGQAALRDIRLSRKLASSELQEFISRFDDVKIVGNVRAAVKQIWTFPHSEYLPWCSYESPNLARVIDDILDRTVARFSLVEGKVYMVTGDINAKIWEQHGAAIQTALPGFELQSNKEVSHVTIINSNIVAGAEIDQVKELVRDFELLQIKLHCIGFQHTVSLDYSRFSVCLVAKIECPAVDDFILAFNHRFNTNLKLLQPHVTIGVIPRQCAE